MVIVVGYLVAAVAAIVIAWLAAGRDYTVARHAGVDLGELGGRHVSILGSLSGFAVTGMVLLVTLGKGPPRHIRTYDGPHDVLRRVYGVLRDQPPVRQRSRP